MKTQAITLTEIVDHKYVLSNEDLARFATLSVSTQDVLVSLRQAYLRVLLAGTQIALGLTAPRQNGVRKPEAIGDEDRTAQLKALNETHANYYAVIVGAVTTPEIADSNRLGADERHRRAVERNRRTNYARTAKSALKALVGSGYSLLEVNVLTISKAQIQSLVIRRSTRPKDVATQMPQRLTAIADRFVHEAKALAEVDPTGATDAINRAMEQLGTLAIDLGLKPARKLDIGVKEHRPIRLKEGTFWPLTIRESVDGQGTAVQ